MRSRNHQAGRSPALDPACQAPLRGFAIVIHALGCAKFLARCQHVQVEHTIRAAFMLHIGAEIDAATRADDEVGELQAEGVTHQRALISDAKRERTARIGDAESGVRQAERALAGAYLNVADRATRYEFDAERAAMAAPGKCRATHCVCSPSVERWIRSNTC